MLARSMFTRSLFSSSLTRSFSSSTRVAGKWPLSLFSSSLLFSRSSANYPICIYSGLFTRSFSSQPAPRAEDNPLGDAKVYHTEWADFRDEVVEVQATRNAEGDLVGTFQGEQVIFPDMENTLEWVLTTPVDLHLFDEVPFFKVAPEDDGGH